MIELLKTRALILLGNTILAYRWFIAPWTKPKGQSPTVMVAVECKGVLGPGAWDGPELPRISGKTRVDVSFQPTIMATEIVTVTFRNQDVESVRTVTVDEVSDGILVESSLNTVPKLDDTCGITLTCLKPLVVERVIWPAITAETDVKFSCAVKRSVMYRVPPPAGFTYEDVVQVEVEFRLNMFGPVVES